MDDKKRTCPTCDGTGYEMKIKAGNFGIGLILGIAPIPVGRTRVRCTRCHGKGKIDGQVSSSYVGY